MMVMMMGHARGHDDDDEELMMVKIISITLHYITFHIITGKIDES